MGDSAVLLYIDWFASRNAMGQIDLRKENRIRAELLAHLREGSGFRYSELAEMDFFSDLSTKSLGAICHRMA